MNKEITILLPSVREELVKQRIKEWKQTNSDVNYEIIVISPFPCEEIGTIWLNDINKKGSVHATNLGLGIAQGKYIIYFSDDVQPTKGCLRKMIDFMDSQSTHPFLGAFKMQTDSGKEIGPFGAYNKLYACYGCISIEDLILSSGILFRPEFKYSWCDIDLSLRIWEKGGKVEICKEAIVIPRQVEDEGYKEHRKNYFQQDVNTFLGIWHNKLGKGIERTHSAVNKKLKS
jgi:hypothetical protein